MTESALEGRITSLEDLMADVLQSLVLLREQLAEQAARSDEEFRRLREQLAEQAARTDQRLAEQAARTDQRLAELAAQTDEEIKRAVREMRRQWGELSNKMGTLAEDLVAPSIPRVLRTVVECPEDAVESVAVRVRRRHPKTRQVREFDVVATCGEYLLINETKSRLRPEHIREFVEELKHVRMYFPEYADRKVIGCIASLYVDPSLVRFGEGQGLIVLGFGEDAMDVLNSPEFTPRIF